MSIRCGFEVWIQGTCLSFVCSIDFLVIHENPFMFLNTDTDVSDLYPVSYFFLDMYENDYELRNWKLLRNTITRTVS
jgi:hypothetical protein